MAITYNSNYDETIPFSDVSESFHLTTNTEVTYTVPGAATDIYSARFGFNMTSNVFVCNNGTATIPGANTASAVPYQELNPQTQRYVKGGDVLSFVTPDTNAYASVSLRSLNR